MTDTRKRLAEIEALSERWSRNNKLGIGVTFMRDRILDQSCVIDELIDMIKPYVEPVEDEKIKSFSSLLLAYRQQRAKVERLRAELEAERETRGQMSHVIAERDKLRAEVGRLNKMHHGGDGKYWYLRWLQEVKAKQALKEAGCE